MKLPNLNPYFRASLALLAAAALLIALAMLTDRRDLTSAALVIAALACLITGIFIATLSTTEPLDVRYVSLLAAPGALALCGTAANLGIQGAAHILPSSMTGRSAPLQYNPVAGFTGMPDLPSDEVLVFGEQATGMVTEPAGAFLLERMRKDEQLVVPPDPADLPAAAREIALDLLGIADRAGMERDGDAWMLTLAGYRLAAGCRALQERSPRCCAMFPCPVASLFACVVSESTGRVVAVERCGCSPDADTVTAVYLPLPLPDREPEVEVPVAGVDPVHAADPVR